MTRELRKKFLLGEANKHFPFYKPPNLGEAQASHHEEFLVKL